MVAETSRSRRGLPLTLRLAVALGLASFFVALLVAFLGAERIDREGVRQREQDRVGFVAELAERMAPQLERGDMLRVAILATAARDLSNGRVLVLDRTGKVCVDTALALGERQLGLLASSGAFQRTLDQDDHKSVLRREALAPVRLGGEVVGEIRLQHELLLGQTPFAWSLFGTVFLCCMSLVAVGAMMSHHWSTRVRKATNALMHLAVGEVSGASEQSGPGELQELSLALHELDRGMHAGLNRVAEGYLELATQVLEGLQKRGLIAAGHGERTARYAALLAARLGLLPQDRRDLELACKLHELGKAWVRPTILQKQGPLDQAERQSLRQHAQRGAAMFDFFPSLRRVAIIVRHQGERYDGHGHPEGLRGDRIPLGARILAIASAYDLATVCSQSEPTMDREQALRQLQADRGTVFDPWLLDLFGVEVRRADLPPHGDKPVMISPAGVVPYKTADSDLQDPLALDDSMERDLACELEIMFDEGPPEEKA
jgi:HD-GYP domain-containing protein (c-di-GMP phosphodiesterase class II)